MEKSLSVLFSLILVGSLGLYLHYDGGMLAGFAIVSWHQGVLLLMTVSASLILSFAYIQITRNQSWDKGYVLRSIYIFAVIWGGLALYSYGVEELLGHELGEKLEMLNKSLTTKGILIALILAVVIVWIDYSWFAYAVYSKETIGHLRNERKKEELQFKLLRSQLTPHFLFNSLNTASNLIVNQPEQAEEFIRKLAFNFTNLTKNGLQPLNTLKQELDIIENYMHLMHIRYGRKVVLEQRIKPCALQRYLPALGIQLLVENALKHNVASLEIPLKIIITADHEQVAVANTITQKPQNIQSNGVGLANLTARYQHHNGKPPRIYQSEGFYYVCLPYITPTTGKR